MGYAVLIAENYDDGMIRGEVKGQTESRIQTMTSTLDNAPDLLGVELH